MKKIILSVLCLGFVAPLQSMNSRKEKRKEQKARKKRIKEHKKVFRDMLKEDKDKEQGLKTLNTHLKMYKKLYEKNPSTDLKEHIEALEQVIDEKTKGR